MGINPRLYDVCLWYVNADGHLGYADFFLEGDDSMDVITKALKMTTPFVRSQWFEATARNRRSMEGYSYPVPNSIRLMRELNQEVSNG